MSAFPPVLPDKPTSAAPPPKRKLRVNRVSAAVVEGNFGCVIACNGDVIEIEVPADIAVGASHRLGHGRLAIMREIGDVQQRPTRCSPK